VAVIEGERERLVMRAAPVVGGSTRHSFGGLFDGVGAEANRWNRVGDHDGAVVRCS